MKKIPVALRLRPDLRAAFEKRSQKEGCSFTALVERAMEQLARRWKEASGEE